MLRTLGLRGFRGLGVDLSEEALSEAQAGLAGLEERIRVAEAGAERGTGLYDYVMAMEVLEHFRDDLGALRQWRQYLEPAGRLVFSVPADPKKWGPLDEAAGHYRRYTRPMIRELLARTGFRVEYLWCYGFPITNLTLSLTNRIYQWGLDMIRTRDMQTRTAQSGLDRSVIRPYRFLWTNPLFRAVGAVQMLFREADWGNGYVVRAQAAGNPA